MKSYSLDLRQKIVSAYEKGGVTQKQVAHNFGVSAKCVNDIWQRYLTTGSAATKPHGGGNPGKINSDRSQWLVNYFTENPDHTFVQAAQIFGETFGITITSKSIGEHMKRLGWSRKKNILRPRNQH